MSGAGPRGFGGEATPRGGPEPATAAAGPGWGPRQRDRPRLTLGRLPCPSADAANKTHLWANTTKTLPFSLPRRGAEAGSCREATACPALPGPRSTPWKNRLGRGAQRIPAPEEKSTPRTSAPELSRGWSRAWREGQGRPCQSWGCFLEAPAAGAPPSLPPLWVCVGCIGLCQGT